MFIESLSISYPEENWQLEKTSFDQLNLLVGASGVGKTRILEAIDDLVRISVGNLRSLEVAPTDTSMDWNLQFRNEREQRVEWSGKIVHRNAGPLDPSGIPQLNIAQEQIIIDGKEKSRRLDDGILFDGNKIPRLSSLQSLLRIFMDDEDIRNAVIALRRVTEIAGFDFQFKHEHAVSVIGRTLESMRGSRENLILKLYWAFENQGSCPVWRDIVIAFQDIFTDIEDVRIHRIPYVEDGKEWSLFEVEFKERGVGVYALYEMSEGMRKTFEVIATLHLCPGKSLILIDEFENSLGPNCIDLVADAVNRAGRGLQFIITSHHPYIINRIGTKHWKIVTRDGGVVTTHTAEELGIGRSRHESYDQLIQLPAYQTGSLAE